MTSVGRLESRGMDRRLRHHFYQSPITDSCGTNSTIPDDQQFLDHHPFKYIGAHRTPSSDGCRWQISADDRAHTIGAMFRCGLVCPLTIVRFDEDIRGLGSCHTARAVSHIAGRAVGGICSPGGTSCRVIH
jgi:hypothetical protein